MSIFNSSDNANISVFAPHLAATICTRIYFIGSYGGSLLGMICNLLVLVVLLHRRLYCLDNRSLFITLLTQWSMFYSFLHFTQNFQGVFYRRASCKSLIGILFSTSVLVHFTMALISLDQFIHIYHPLRYHQKMRKRNATILIFIEFSIAASIFILAQAF